MYFAIRYRDYVPSWGAFGKDEGTWEYLRADFETLPEMEAFRLKLVERAIAGSIDYKDIHCYSVIETNIDHLYQHKE